MVHFNISVAVKRRRDNSTVKKRKPLLIIVFAASVNILFDYPSISETRPLISRKQVGFIN